MSTPRTKRQFAGAASDPAQRQITSFFNPSATSSSSPSLSAFHPPSHSESPALPASVQSNLISVGMRVRKSVPEGYKTGTYSAFSLWDDANMKSNSTQPDADGSSTPTSPDRRSRANAFSTPRELVPFCGIHRVGGLDVQPGWETTPSFSSFGNSPGLDDLPGLTSSQDSAASTDSWATEEANTKKRFFVDDEDESRKTTQGNFLAPAAWDNGRVIAVPKKMRMHGKTTNTAASTNAGRLAPTSRRYGGMDQENVMILDTDFGEADFLDQQSNWEVAMNDA